MVKKYSKLSPLYFGLAGGLILALITFLTTLAGIYGLMGGFPLYNALINDTYGGIGFSLTLTGVLLGPLYSFIDGFVIVFALAWIYNKLI